MHRSVGPSSIGCLQVWWSLGRSRRSASPCGPIVTCGCCCECRWLACWIGSTWAQGVRFALRVSHWHLSSSHVSNANDSSARRCMFQRERGCRLEILREQYLTGISILHISTKLMTAAHVNACPDERPMFFFWCSESYLTGNTVSLASGRRWYHHVLTMASYVPTRDVI